MKKYRIDGSRYGGEYVIGTVSADFVRYWQERSQDDLLSHLLSLEWDDDSDDQDENSPSVFDDPEQPFGAWYEVDDLEHATAADASGGFYVTNVTDQDEQYYYDEDSKYVDGYQLLGREAYIADSEPDWDDLHEDDDWVPVLMFHSSEKGSFGVWFFETEELDMRKLAYTTVETEFGEFVESVYYDKVELETDYDYCDSRGKAYYATVGWFNKRWHDTPEKYDEEYWKEVWEMYDEEFE